MEIILTDPAWPYTRAKTAVLTAAASVIREEGPRAATLKNIASRAGITEPAIFRHFDGVDGLFEGLFSVYERIHARFEEAYRAEGKGLARLRAAVASIVDSLAASGDFAYLVLNARQVFREYAELKDKIAERDMADHKSVLGCVEEGVKAGEIRGDVDPASIAVALSGGINSIVALWIETGFAFDLKQICLDRWDDVERLVATKVGPKQRESKDSAAAKARFAAIFSMKPARPSKASKATRASKAKAKAAGKKGAAAPAKKAAAKSAVKTPAVKAAKSKAPKAKPASPKKPAAKPAASKKK